jgi:PKD repeat protein
MKKKLLLILVISSIGILRSQQIKGSEIRVIEKAGEISSLAEINENWDVHLRSLSASANKGPISEEALAKIREEARDETNKVQKGSRRILKSPNLGMRFESNRSNGSVPPDNAIAVSDNGHIISCVNANIWIGRADGKLDKTSALLDFFKKVQLGGGYFDPRVVFDQKYKRFIVICLVGNTSATSHVVLAASKAEDPNLGFNFYKIKGDLLGDDLWFDYPGVGMTRDELFINGNMFTATEPASFRYSTIFQIDKKSMFEGLPLKMKDYPKLTNTNGGIIFNCTPTLSIDSSDTENVAHFLSSRTSGSNLITYCKIAGKLDQNPSYEAVRTIETTPYQVAPLADMKNNNDKLRTNDCRIQYCLKQGNIIHFAFTSRVDTLSGIYLGRYDLVTGKMSSYKYSDPGFYSAYPGISYLGNVEGEETYVLHYLRSNEEEFPEMATVMIGGKGEEFFVSPSQLVRKGETAVTALSGNERWGDYSTACTRYNPQGGIEVWVNGCYGRPSYASFTAQLIHPDSIYNDFFPSASVGVPGDTISLSHVSTDSLTEVVFNIEGAKKIDLNGKTYFVFDKLGTYSGSMLAKDSRGNNIKINKQDIINIKPKISIPVTDFSADKLVIFEGDSIQFFDISTNEPNEWKWSFSGGEPEKSTIENPKVFYPQKGSFNVLLNAANESGSLTKFRPRYVTVKERPLAPIINFSSNKNIAVVNDTISFFDQSENNPFAWKWLFINDKDTMTSTSQNPKMTFTKIGNYNVSLSATNEGGTSELYKKDFFNIGVLLSDQEQLIEKSNIYPNPSSDRISLTFYSPKAQVLKYEIYDIVGRLVKTLIEKNVGSGQNELSFSVDPLVNGRYTLRVVSEAKHLAQSFNFIVQK